MNKLKTKLLFAFSFALFSCNSMSNNWNADISDKQKERIINSIGDSFPIKESQGTKGLQESAGVDITDKESLLLFIGNNLTLIKNKKEKNILCNSEYYNCLVKKSENGFNNFKIPVVETEIWAAFNDQSSDNNYIALSNNGYMKLDSKTIVYNIREEDSLFPSYDFLKVFSASLASHYIRDGVSPFKLCKGNTSDYLCSSDSADYFINMFYFLDSILKNCKKCNKDQELIITALKYSMLMRVDDKKTVLRAYSFFQRYKKRLSEINYTYKDETDIYYSFYLK